MEIEAYRDLKLVGEGGMAYVYKAVQRSLDRPVAIKVLKQKLADEEEIRERFFQESHIIAHLNHPNIIQVIDRGLTNEGSPYFVMPFIKGVSLDQAFKKQALKQHQALDIFTQVCKGLAYAHKNDVIHCDIKPENILVDFEGHAVILDFGISQLFSETNEQEDRFILGTDNYMAPEQKEGLSKTSKKSDLYSLGVMMYRYISSKIPSDPPQSLAQFDSKTPKLLDDLVISCIQKNASDRPESAEQVKNILLKILQGDHLNSKQKQRAQQDVKKSFQLLDIIKETRHGAIYLFEEMNSQELFVIKKKPSNSGGYEQAKRIVDVQHPNINTVYGSSNNARVFIFVSRYCGGGSLADRLIQRFELENFYPVAIGIAEGMQAAHKNKILHGNLRPSNVLFSEEGAVKLVDFGLIEHYQRSDDNWYTCLNEERSIKGDIYAAGVIFYQMLMGETPHSGTSNLIKKFRFSKYPPALQQLVRNMMHKDPNKRVATFEEVSHCLREIFDGDETQVRSIQTANAIPLPSGNNKAFSRWWLVWGGILAALILSAQFYLLLQAI